jgi:hypothetical protein
MPPKKKEKEKRGAGEDGTRGIGNDRTIGRMLLFYTWWSGKLANEQGPGTNEAVSSGCGAELIHNRLASRVTG